MYKGIYIAVSGAILKQKQLEVISQNIANGSTAGYKKDALSFSDYLLPNSAQSPDGRSMSTLSTFATDFSNGTLVRSGNSLDIAIEGDGFIALEGNRYTRKGDLRRDKDGYLVTGTGVRVMGQGGPIQIPEGSVEISEKGDIIVNGAQVGTISIKSFQNGAGLAKAGNGLFTARRPGADADAKVRQGYLELSNVEVVREMIKMIETEREFESYQKVIQSFDDASSKVNNELARL